MSSNIIKAVDARPCSCSTVREMVARMHLVGGGKAFKPEARGYMLSSESTLDLTINSKGTRDEQHSKYATLSQSFRQQPVLPSHGLVHSAPGTLVLVTVLVTVLVLTTALETVLVTVVLAGPLVIKHEHAEDISPLPRPSEMWMPPGKPSEISS